MNNFVYEASMEDSFIYKTLNSSAGLIEKIVKYIKTSVALGKEYWEEQYSQIAKGFISPLCGRVLEAYNNGLIELLYSRDTKIGTSIPFIVRKKDNFKHTGLLLYIYFIWYGIGRLIIEGLRTDSLYLGVFRISQIVSIILILIGIIGIIYRRIKWKNIK